MSHQLVFLSVVSSSKLSNCYLPLSLIACHIQYYFKNKRGRKRKFINPHKEKARRKERRKQIFGFGFLVSFSLI